MIMQVSVEHFEEVLASVAKWEAQDKKTAEAMIKKFFPGKKLIDKKAAAELLSCSPRQVDYLRENYGLPWIRLGAIIKFDPEEVQKWLREHTFSGPGCVPCMAKKAKEETA